MTHDEAMKWVENRMMHGTYNECNNAAELANKAAELAINALKKQIPEKPNKTRWHGTMLNYCPDCGKGIPSESIIYCNHCGQKIDWTGVTE